MNGQRILVVDDHESMLVAIKSILDAEGYDVFTATDGIEALRVMENVYPDLILADIMMPRMDGYTFYEEVRSQAEWVPIPFIFLTAKSEHEDVLKGKKLGAEDYITKPFDAEELVVAVQARLTRAQAIQEAAEMEFERLKQQIVTILGHELRTPLTYVSGYTDLALDDLASLSLEELQEFLLGIKRGSDRLNRLVEDLLMLVRLDTGRAEKEFDMLVAVYPDLGGIVEQTVRQHQEQAEAEDMRLEVSAEPDLPPVRLCESFFVDALGRLVENAIKFSGNGESVTVRVEAGGEDVQVSVSDEGVGIPSQAIPHLFERFRQFDRERQEQQGVGLGLAIAYELIKLHQGEIAVESTLGEGSKFTILLPPYRG